jgi:hypothetical protein
MSKLYDKIYEEGENLLNKGYDYKNDLLNKTTSKYLQQNKSVNSFMSYVNDILYTLIESVKRIRVFHNFTVKEDYKKIP